MIAFSTGRILCVLSGVLILAGWACKSKDPTKPDQQPALPALTDPIPYAKLGQRGKLVFERIETKSNSAQGLYVLDIANGRSAAIDGNYETPSVSPDGKRIIYVQNIRGTTEWEAFVMNVDGGNPQNISGIAGRDLYSSWNGNSTEALFYVDSPTAAEARLYRQSAISNPLDRVQLLRISPGLPSGRASVSSTNKLALIGAFGSGTAIYTMNSDGTGLKSILAESGASDSVVVLRSPAWSPDGQKIAYLTAFKKDGNSRYSRMAVNLMNADGSDQRQLLSLPTDWENEVCCQSDITLCWSLDGTKIAFNKFEADLFSHLYMINADGSGLTQITFAPNVVDRNVSWSN